MSASDILLGKPGGLTTSEALAKGLAFVIVNPIPGQEERNSDHLLEEGVALRCNNLAALPWKIERLLTDRQRLESMKANALHLGKPRAAQDIVTTCSIMGVDCGHVDRQRPHSCDSPRLKLIKNLKRTKLIASRV
jgi:processive 1,2-diacylglycerol beta-glucosyltransferase